MRFQKTSTFNITLFNVNIPIYFIKRFCSYENITPNSGIAQVLLFNSAFHNKKALGNLKRVTLVHPFTLNF